MINRQLVFSRQEHLYRHIGFASSSITTSSLPSLVCPSCRSFLTLWAKRSLYNWCLLSVRKYVAISQNSSRNLLGSNKIPFAAFFLSVCRSVCLSFTLFHLILLKLPRLCCFIYDCLPLHMLCVWNMIRIIMRNDGYWCVMYIHTICTCIFIFDPRISYYTHFSAIF